jgi:hypothetical protein
MRRAEGVRVYLDHTHICQKIDIVLISKREMRSINIFVAYVFGCALEG